MGARSERRGTRRLEVWAVVVCALVVAAAAQTPALPLPGLSPQQLSEVAAQGRQLFTGRVRLQNRGPACIACHSAGALGFPNGGTLGPDLTHVYAKMGPAGVASALQTLYFPAMFPLYESHPLTPTEETELDAFFQATNAAQPAAATPKVLGLAAIIFVILLLITGFLGRKRLRGVRHRMVAAAQQAPRRADLLRAPAPAPAIETREEE